MTVDTFDLLNCADFSKNEGLGVVKHARVPPFFYVLRLLLFLLSLLRVYCITVAANTYS